MARGKHIDGEMMCDGLAKAGSAPTGMLSRYSGTSERHHLARVGLDLSAVGGPGVHQLAALFEEVAAPIGRLNSARYRVRKCHLGNLAGEARALGGPVAERRAQSVNGEGFIA